MDQNKYPFFLKKEEENRRSSENAKGSLVNIKGIFWDSLHTETEVTQLYPILCDPMDCSLPGSSTHGISQARVLEWVAISSSRGSSQPRDRTRVSCIAGRRFTIWTTREAMKIWSYPYNLNMELGFSQFVSFFSLWVVVAFSSCGAWVSHCGGFSCCRPQALGPSSSVVAACRPQSSWHAGSRG